MKKQTNLIIALTILLIVTVSFTACGFFKEPGKATNLQTFEFVVPLSGENDDIQVAVLGVYDSRQIEQIVCCDLQKIEDKSSVGFAGSIMFFLNGNSVLCSVNGDLLDEVDEYIDLNISGEYSCSYFSFNTDKKMPSGRYVYEDVEVEF